MEEGHITDCPTCGVAISGVEDPTPAEGRVLDFILAFHDQNGRFPTYREIRVKFGYRSHQSVRYHVDKLDRKGWLTVRRTRMLQSIDAARRRNRFSGGTTSW